VRVDVRACGVTRTVENSIRGGLSDDPELVALTLALALVAGAVAVGWDPVLGVALVLTGATSRGSS